MQNGRFLHLSGENLKCVVRNTLKLSKQFHFLKNGEWRLH